MAHVHNNYLKNISLYMKPIQDAFFQMTGKRLGFQLTHFLNDMILTMLFREMENTTFHGNSLDNGVSYLSKNESILENNIGIIYHQLNARFGFRETPEAYVNELMDCLWLGLREFMFFIEDYSKQDNREHNYIYQYQLSKDVNITFPMFNLELIELKDIDDVYHGLSEGEYFIVY